MLAPTSEGYVRCRYCIGVAWSTFGICVGTFVDVSTSLKGSCTIAMLKLASKRLSWTFGASVWLLYVDSRKVSHASVKISVWCRVLETVAASGLPLQVYTRRPRGLFSWDLYVLWPLPWNCAGSSTLGCCGKSSSEQEKTAPLSPPHRSKSVRLKECSEQRHLLSC